MTITIRPLHPLFVGEVTGVDLSRPLSQQEVAAIEAGMDRHAVLLFRDQPLTDEQQMAFSRHFGPLENPHGGNIPRASDVR
ncbi:MAG TPA: TauD/TfdA family dioxygenase, partial [Burkholderiaceae bacterium]|nr:TauD/TfdA family dioxygenase [Burkholderiaceae bacterium]